MVDRIRTAAGIEGIAVSEEDLRTERTHNIDNTRRIVRTDVGEVARFSEMDLDGCELAVEVDVSDSRLSDQSFEFCKEVVPWYCPEVSEIDFRFFHSFIRLQACP